ncbi:MAG: Dabb family protein [Bernardetiaceae bacterium]|jgi:hypothetical protein|nr:Dabb family protein [Bernardetiaceae bacterium]
MKNRLLWLISGLALVGTLTSCTRSAGLPGRFVHVVYFWAKPGATAADLAELRKGIETLRPISHIAYLQLGTPAGTPRQVVDNSYAYCLILHFENAAAQDAYQKDPIHLKFVEQYQTYWERVQVYDSILQ